MAWRDSVDVEFACAYVPAVAALMKKHGFVYEASNILESIKRYKATEATITINKWPIELLREVVGELQGAVPVPTKLLSVLKGFGRILTDPYTAKIKSIKLLPELLARYLASDAIDGWVYRAVDGGRHVAYAIDNIYYHEPHNNDGSPYVVMKMKANKASTDDRGRSYEGITSINISFSHSDISGKTVDQVLFAEEYLKETEELKAAYLEDVAQFEVKQPMLNKQFLCTGNFMDEEASWWDERKRWVGVDAKMVNDEGELQRKFKNDFDSGFFADYRETPEAFIKMPLHPYIYMFDLNKHTNCWVHASNCSVYQYDASLKDKLVLPEVHRELIDVLVTDLDVFVDDIIKGKSGGTSILCYGGPGLGKTLTAEVYSEIVERPLYKVHAGQLGTSLDSVEKELEDILKRGERWGAIMLIDEADVYIRKRDNDMEHNAVVAAFLRTLEYFNGLLFLTTNRIKDVDDAIVSRMVAMFRFDLPTPESRRKIWMVLAKQFNIPVSAKLLGELVTTFDEVSGRDIKQLLKLTSKYCSVKKVPLSLEAFRICSVFRGII